MYEKRREKLLSPPDFAIRVAQHGGIVAAATVVALAIGVIGYHVTIGLPWIDALMNASMILSGMGPVDAVATTAGKLFASFYALFSGIFFIAASGVLLAPFLHRLIHWFHIEDEGERS